MSGQTIYDKDGNPIFTENNPAYVHMVNDENAGTVVEVTNTVPVPSITNEVNPTPFEIVVVEPMNTGWVALDQYMNGATSFSSAFTTKVKRYGDVVNFHATLINVPTAFPTSVITLPQQYRPLEQKTFICESSGYTSFAVDINPTGIVRIKWTTNQSPSLTTWYSIEFSFII